MKKLHVISAQWDIYEKDIINLFSYRFRNVISIPYDNEKDSPISQVRDYLINSGHSVIGTADGITCQFFMCEPVLGSFTKLR